MIVPRRNELLVLATGGVLGLLRVAYTVEGMPTWLDVYLLLSTALLFGFLALAIYRNCTRRDGGCWITGHRTRRRATSRCRSWRGPRSSSGCSWRVPGLAIPPCCAPSLCPS